MREWKEKFSTQSYPTELEFLIPILMGKKQFSENFQVFSTKQDHDAGIKYKEVVT